MGIANLVHITDTHLFAEDNGRLLGQATEPTLRAVLADIAEVVPSPDAVVVTGDLVHDEKLSSYQRLRVLLEQLGAPVHCIPGNHDDPELMAQVFAGGPAALGRVAVVGSWRLLLVDTTERHRVGGRLSEASWMWMRQQLRQCATTPTLICLHHHPVPVGSLWLDALGLERGQELVDVALSAGNVRALLWGHVHQEWDARAGEMRLLATPASCVQFLPGSASFALDSERGPGWRWLQLHPDGRVDTVVRYV
jgi:Icc protein